MSFYGLVKREGETDFEYCLRCCLAKHNKQIDAEWQDIIEAFPLLNNVHRDTLRKNFVGKMGVGEVVEYYEDKIALLATKQTNSYDNEVLDKIKEEKHDLFKERVKLRDERNELRRLLTTEARWDKVLEILKETIVAYEPTPSDYIVHHKYQGGKNEACLLLSDWHIGSEIWTFHNKFNLDIAKGRINHLKEQTIKYCELHKVETLYIEMLGDLISGNIHITTRLNNTENVIQQTIETSEILGEFIYDLSLAVPNIKLVYAIGNHGRVSANVKESINEENFEYLIRWHLETKLKNIDNIEWIHNVINREVATFTLDNGRTIASAHGHKEKNYKDAVKNLSHYLDVVKVDEVHIGHFHNPQIINNVIVNGCLSGVDDYAQDLRFNEAPSQTLRVYDEDGNFITYQINL